MDAMRQSIEKMVASPVPVVTYVAPSGGRAASAGFFLLEAGDVAAMAPGTNTGAAHPVVIGAEMDPVMKQKVENDAAALLRSICTKRGRNSALAEKAVLESKSFTDKEALDQHLIDLVAAQTSANCWTQLDGRTDHPLRRHARQTLHTARRRRSRSTSAPCGRRSSPRSRDPNIALILLVLGALGDLRGVHFARA